MYIMSTLSSSDSWSPTICTAFSALSHIFVIAAALAAADSMILPLLQAVNKGVTALLLLLNWGKFIDVV